MEINEHPAAPAAPTPTAPLYAGFWARVGAFYLDSLILIITQLILIGPFLKLVRGTDPGHSWLPFPLRFVSIALILLYYIFFTYRYRATPGKMILGLKVLPQGQPGRQASLFTIIIRESIGKFLASLLFNVGFLLAGFTAQKQGLHDKIAKTVVIATSRRRRQIAIIVAIVIAAATLLLSFVALPLLLLTSVGSARKQAEASAAKARVQNLSQIMDMAQMDHCTQIDLTKGPIKGGPECGGQIYSNQTFPSSPIASGLKFDLSATNPQDYTISVSGFKEGGIFICSNGACGCQGECRTAP